MNDCVTLCVHCLRQGKCFNNLQLLHWNSKLETQLSNIVGDCSHHKFKSRGTDTIDDLIKSTFPQSTSNKRDSNQYGLKRIIDDGSPTSYDDDNHHTTTNNSIPEDGGLSFIDNADEDNNLNDESPTTTDGEDPNNTTDHSTLEDVDVEGSNNTLSTNDDNDKGNNDDTTNHIITYKGDDNETTLIQIIHH